MGQRNSARVRRRSETGAAEQRKGTAFGGNRLSGRAQRYLSPEMNNRPIAVGSCLKEFLGDTTLSIADPSCFKRLGNVTVGAPLSAPPVPHPLHPHPTQNVPSPWPPTHHARSPYPRAFVTSLRHASSPRPLAPSLPPLPTPPRSLPPPSPHAPTLPFPPRFLSPLRAPSSPLTPPHSPWQGAMTIKCIDWPAKLQIRSLFENSHKRYEPPPPFLLPRTFAPSPLPPLTPPPPSPPHAPSLPSPSHNGPLLPSPFLTPPCRAPHSPLSPPWQES
ncbi:unnamed protein product, partial [Closterium sp. NIES-65]